MKGNLDLSGVDLLWLVQQDVTLKKKARTNGGEWAGPSPDGTCTEDGFIVWPHHPDGRGRWWNRRTDEGGDAVDYLVRYRGLSPSEAIRFLGLGVEPIREATSKSTRLGPVVAEYIYMDASGTPVLRVTRHEPKAFRNWHLRTGEWRPGRGRVQTVLYRLPELLRSVQAGEEVYVVEGEKSADYLYGRGLMATTNPDGARKWREAYSQALVGADVYVIPDQDADGHAHAELVAASVYPYAASVKVVYLDDLPFSEVKGRDVVDWFEAGHTLAEFMGICRGTPAWELPVDRRDRQVEYTAAELLQESFPEPVWVVPGILSAGLAFLAGRPKVGKSWLALQVAVAVGTGGRVLEESVEQGPVLFLALEDNPRRVQDRVVRLGMPSTADIDFVFSFPHLAEGGAAALQVRLELRSYRLVVVDTLSRVAGGLDQQDVGEMTGVLGGLQRAAFERNVAILLVDHHRKNAGFVEDVVDDVLGSTAKSAVADVVVGLFRKRGQRDVVLRAAGRDMEDRDLRVVFDHTTGCWQLVGDENELEVSDRQAEIVQVLRDLGEASNRRIAEAVGGDRSNVYRRLQDLVRMGRVIRVGRGRDVRYALSELEQHL